METNELQELWKKTDLQLPERSMIELNIMLTARSRRAVSRFTFTTALSVLICAGLILFLWITSSKRPDDHLLHLNNLLLGIISTVSFASGLYSWYRLRKDRYSIPVKNWLKERIDLLSRWLTGPAARIPLYILPLIYILTVLSIHVYYEQLPFSEVLRQEDSLIGLAVALPIGLFTSYYALRKIRQDQTRTIGFMKDLYRRLCEENEDRDTGN